MAYSTGGLQCCTPHFVPLHWGVPVLEAYITPNMRGREECHYKANSNQGKIFLLPCILSENHSSPIMQQMLQQNAKCGLCCSRPWNNLPSICFDLKGMSPRRVNAQDDTSPGSIMTHLLFLGDNLGTAMTDDTSYTQVKTTAWQIHADRAGSQIFFYADHCCLTACCYEFCSWSQFGEKKTVIVSVGSWSTSALLSSAP